MSWWQLGPSLVAAAVLLFGPGLLIGASIGLRKLSLLASAPALGSTLISVWALAAGALGLSYTPIGLLLAGVAVAGLALCVRAAVRLIRRSAPRSGTQRPLRPAFADIVRTFWPAAVGTTLGAMLIGWRLKIALDRPENISQTYDNIFHLNAVQYGIETGDASSLTITRFLSDVDPPSLYPAAWHDVVISVTQLTGGILPFSVNATNIILAAVVWPLACIFLARQIFGSQARVALFTGILSSAFAAFPLLMLDFGVLYPYMMSLALLPIAIGFLISAFRAASEEDQGPVRASVALVLILPGIGLAHPSTVLSFLLLITPFLVLMVVRRLRRYSRADESLFSILWPIIMILLFVEVLRRLWLGVRPLPEASRWEARATQAQAIGEALAAAPLDRPVAWVVFALTLGGLSILLRRGPAWLAVSFGLASALYVVANGTVFGDFRSFVTGVWYNDPFRLAALLPVLGVPLTVVAVLAIHAWSEDRVARLITNPSRRRTAQVITVGTVALVLGWSSQGESMEVATASAKNQYQMTNDSPLLSTDERDLLDKVDDVIPSGETVIASPWTGASLVYPLASRESITPYVFGERTADVTLVLQRLSDVSDDPAVCKALQSQDSYWVLDFGPREIHDGAHTAPGLIDLSRNPGVELRSSVGDARLYEITACERQR